jgi:hypothetical protein
MDTYKEYKTHLENYYNSLPDTHIKYLFFFKTQLDKPKVKDVFKRMTILNKPCYMGRGIQGAGWYYIYQESVLRYLVTAISPPDANGVYNVLIDSESPTGDVQHGDHLDFGIILSRSAGIVVKNHKTVYDLDIGAMTFSRSEVTCDFSLKNSDLRTLASFSQTQCERGIGKIKDTYDALNQRIVYKLVSGMVSGHFQGGGGKPRASLPTIQYEGKTKKLYSSQKKGNYIMKGGKRFYDIHQGGGYKGITFLSNTFIQFLSDNLFKRVAESRPDLESVQVIFDEMNELGPESNKYIVILYDFVDYQRSVFYIDSIMALTACYVENNRQSTNTELTENEMNIWILFKQQAVSPVPIHVR